MRRGEKGGSHVAFLLPSMGGGGAERVALSVIHNFLDRGMSVDLLLMQAEGPLLALVPPTVRVIDLRARRIRKVVSKLRRYLAETRPAALQISMWPLTVAGILARILSRTDTRIVVSDHTVLSKQYSGRGWGHAQFLKWSIRIAYPRADARIVVAKEAAEDLARLSGLPTAAFHVVYNPVDPPGDDIEDEQARRLWGGPGKRTLNVARLSPEKNQKLLVSAFAQLAANHEARLMILGEGDLRQQLERQAAELGIADRVLMPGFVLDPGPIYRSADLFVLSSDFEGYPLALVEAMHCGLTIVSTDCLSGPSEILNGGEFGALVPCGDIDRLAEAMEAALDSRPDRERMKARAASLSATAFDHYWQLMTD